MTEIGRGGAARSGRAHAGSCSATATPTTAARRRASTSRSSAIPDEVADAEGDGGSTTSTTRSSPARPHASMPRLLRVWDGGPVTIAGTVAEGDEVAGFEVVHLPGHAPGLIGLWRSVRPPRARQRLLLHARPADRPQGPPARPAPRRSTSTPSRRGRRSASSPRSLEPAGRLGRARRPADRRRARRSSSARPRPPERGRGADAAAAGADKLAAPGLERVPRRRRQRARAARLDDAADAPPSTPGACTASSKRSRARTPGSAPSSSSSSASRCAGSSPTCPPRARRSCSRATGSPPAEERRWIRDVLREHLAEHFPDLEAP